jgi:hypothetical protein
LSIGAVKLSLNRARRNAVDLREGHLQATAPEREVAAKVLTFALLAN